MSINPFPPPDCIDTIYAAHMAAQQTPPTTPARLIKRFGVVFCSLCGFQFDPIRICNCTPVVVSPDDGAQAGLERRVREARGKR